MLANIIQEVFKDINKKINLVLNMKEQIPLKNYIERPVSYICTDKHSNKKYWLSLSFSPAQMYRLQRTINNIELFSNEWKDFFSFNKPLCYGYVNNKNNFYIIYEYLENAKRLESNDKELYDTVCKIIDEKSYTVPVNEYLIENISKDLIIERCPADDDTRKMFVETEEYQHYIQKIKSYNEIRFVKSFCSMQHKNILQKGGNRYLIGFDYGGIDLPAGFDLFCLKKAYGYTDFSDVPYAELHELLYKIHHIKNEAYWIKKVNPKIEINKKDNNIIIDEYGKNTVITINESIFNKFKLSINLKDTEISSASAVKLFNKLKKSYSTVYTLTVKNSPYFYTGLQQDSENLLSFSGIINQEYVNPTNFVDYIKSTQAYKNYSKILPYVKPYWFRALLAVLICIPIGSLDAVIALSLKPYMDLVMVEKSVNSPWYIPFAIVAFTSIQGLLNYLATYMNTWVGTRITNDLKFDLFKKMLTFETAYFDKKKSGDIVFRFNNDADAACAGLLDNLKTFVSRLFSSISLVGVLFYNSWQLALIAMIVLGCAFLPLTKIRKRIKDVLDKSVSISALIITAYNESFAGNKTIASYNLDKIQENKFKNILNNLFSLKIKLVQRTSWLSPMMHVIVSIGIGLAIGYGSHLILTKQITSGNFVSFITALIMLYTPIKNLGNNFNSVQFSFLAIERVFSILHAKPKIQDKKDAIELQHINKIEFKDVNFEYIKDRPVLRNINLKVKAGQTVAFVGNSGGGKSTIISLIPRFYDIKSGAITIDGIDIRDFSLKSLRQNIAIVFQDNFLFSGTIRENIMLGNENATEQQLQEAVKMAYLDEFIAGLTNGLDTQIGERGMLLSGGQKQRVAIARAFLKNAPIVILDEATSALDNKAEAIVQKAIENLMKDKTVFVIAHRLSTIQNADKIVVINQGEIVETGTHEELLKINGGAYKTLYNAQFKKEIAAVN